MHREIERLEEDRVQLKLDNRLMAKQLGQKAASMALEAEDLIALQEYTEALRKRRNNLSNNDTNVDIGGKDTLSWLS